MANKLKIAKKTFALGSGLVVVGGIAIVLLALYSQRENAYARLNKFLDNKITGSGGSSDNTSPDTTAPESTDNPNQNPQQQPQQPQQNQQIYHNIPTVKSPPKPTIPYSYSQIQQQSQNTYVPNLGTSSRTVYKNNPSVTSSDIRRGQIQRNSTGVRTSITDRINSLSTNRTNSSLGPTTSKRPTRGGRNVPTHSSTNSKATAQRKQAEAQRATRYTRNYSNF